MYIDMQMKICKLINLQALTNLEWKVCVRVGMSTELPQDLENVMIGPIMDQLSQKLDPQFSS